MSVNVNKSIQSSNEAVSQFKMHYLHILVFVVLLFSGWFVSPMPPITAMGMKILGVFLGTLYAWLCIDVLWPSLLSMVVLGFTGYAKMGKIFMDGFGSNIFLTLFFFFIFAAYLDATGLNRYIATWLITRKFLIGKPWRLIMMIFIAAYVVATIMGVYAAIVVLWSIVYNIAHTVGLEKRDRLISFILVGIANVVMLGWGLFPFSLFPLQGLASMTKATGVVCDIGKYLIFMTPISLITMWSYYAGGKYLFKLDTSALEKGDYAANLKLEPMTKEQKIAVGFAVVFVLALLALEIVPKNSVIGSVLRQFSTPGMIAAIMVVICLIKTKNNQPIASFQSLASAGSNWTVLILMACTVPLGDALEIKNAGYY